MRRAPLHYSCSALLFLLRLPGCDTSFSRTCAVPTVIPSLEHVTWRESTVTPSRLAISSRLIPCATSSLIFSITSGVNLTGLFIMTAPPVVRLTTYALFRTQCATPKSRMGSTVGRREIGPGADPRTPPGERGRRRESRLVLTLIKQNSSEI